jgi:glycosidase
MFAAMMALLSSELREIEFLYRTATPAKSVVVVGQFNQWDRAANPLAPDETRRTWHGRVSIPVGVYQYLFCIDGNQWKPDPNLPTAADGNGNVNNLLLVEPAAYAAAPARLGDGLITEIAVVHQPDERHRLRRSQDSWRISATTRAGDVERVEVTQGSNRTLMNQRSLSPLLDEWWGVIQSPPGREYALEFIDGTQTLRRGPFALPTDAPLLETPAWVKDAVFYQIFPDRFRNGKPQNDGPEVQAWGSTPTPTGRMGGDLAGIRQGLGYLADLGVTALYLTPVFRANSNHAYDTVDYLQIDPRFGTNEELRDLVRAAHRRGIRVILDGVFNHSSPDFWAFQKLRQEGEASETRNWYFPLRFPIEVREGQQTYRTFAGVPSMPKLNQDDPACRAYFLDVARYWIEYADIDGWRLDVADEVSHDFWREFRRVVKQAKPDAYILGEVWHDAAAWLQGDQFDAVMNYRWRQAALQAFKKEGSMRSLAESLRALENLYPEAALGAMYNLLGSHDTMRVRTVLEDDAGRFAALMALQFTYPGAPGIYYGDELGLAGGREPASRNAFPWELDPAQESRRKFVRRLIRLRRENPEFRSDAVHWLPSPDPESLAIYERGTNQRWRVYVANRATASVPISAARRSGFGVNAALNQNTLQFTGPGFYLYRTKSP